MGDIELDCKGLNCPMPIVKISRTMRGLRAGERLVVEATDPAFQADIEAWVRKLGHSLVSFQSSGGVQRVVIEKSGP